MSGGAWEYVASYVDNKNSNISSYGGSLGTSTDMRTKHVYKGGSSDSQTNNYSANSGVYGDAVYETSTSSSSKRSWHGDFSNFPYSSYPFFGRGGNYDNGSAAGVFSFSGGDYYGSDGGFRPVLCVH